MPTMIQTRAQRILVVEDNADLRRMFRTALVMEGFEVKEVSDGYDALRVLEQNAAELVVLDLRLPLIDGLTVLREMQGRRKVPVVIVTGSNEDVSRFDVACVLRKPITPDKLIAEVRRCLGQR